MVSSNENLSVKIFSVFILSCLLHLVRFGFYLPPCRREKLEETQFHRYFKSLFLFE